MGTTQTALDVAVLAVPVGLVLVAVITTLLIIRDGAVRPLITTWRRHRLRADARRAALSARERHMVAISMQLPPEAGLRQRPRTTDRIGAGR